MPDLTRRQQVEQLLRTLLDYLPTLNRDSTAPRSASTPGPAPGRRARCGRCDTTGRVKGQQPCQQCRTVKAAVEAAAGRWNAHDHHHGCRLCLACDGTGHVIARHGDDPVDEMLRPGKTQQHDDASERAERRRGVEQELARLQQLAAIREEGEAPDWWLAAADRRRQALWAGTSHAELWRLLEHLRMVMPFRYSVLVRVLIYGEEIVLSDRMRDRLDETLGWLADRMPERILVGAGDADRAVVERRSLQHGWSPRHVERRAERDAMIRAAVVSDGLSLREAGARFGMGKSQVGTIVLAADDAQGVASGTAA